MFDTNEFSVTVWWIFKAKDRHTDKNKKYYFVLYIGNIGNSIKPNILRLAMFYFK